MSNKVSVDLSVNVQGFKQGMSEASQSVEQYSTETRKVADVVGNFNKQLSAAKREVKGLALAYAQLSQEEKNSQFGKEIAKQLQEAKQRASELVDMQGDINTELKNMASDTRILNTLSEGFGVIGNAATTAMSAIAGFTGKENDAKKAIVMFTGVTSALSTVTKLQNALQMQSNTMIAVTKIQTLAAAAAEKIRTAAMAKGVVATKSATAAQAALNAVANANPYVLLATAILAVGAACWALASKANKAESAVDKLNREAHETAIQGKKDAQSEIVQLDILYRRATNVLLPMEERRKAAQKLIDQYPASLAGLNAETIACGNAADAYYKLRDAITAAAIAKAYQEKIEQKARERVDLQDQLDAQKEITNQLEKQARAQNQQTGPKTSSGAMPSSQFLGQAEANRAVTASRKEEDRLNQALKDNTTATERYIKLQEEQQTKVGAHNYDNDKTGGGGGGGTGGGRTTSVSSEVKATEGSITKLEAEISALQKKLRDGLVEEKDVDATINRIEELQKQVKELKIRYGFEKPEKVKTRLEELQEKVEKEQKAYILAVDSNNEEAREAAQKAYYAAQEELDNYKLSITIEPKPDPKEIKKQKEEIAKIVNDALANEEIKYDFSNLKTENERAIADAALDQLKKIEDARSKLMEIMNSEDASDAQISAAQEGLEAMHEAWQEVLNDVIAYNNESERLGAVNERMQGIANTTSDVGKAVQAAGDMFTALGEAADDKNFQVAGIIAKAIATVALSFAEALTTCKTWIDWLAFGLTGSATMLSMIGQIKSATSGYAEGGIVGGSSYHGDNILARVNSGEMLLNQRQQKNLFNLLDGDVMPQRGGANVTVTGVIKGTDLLLVQKNTNKKLSRTGSQISIGG